MLNIKEIFKSDLDPNSPNWWAKDKVDKINFNFNQLEKGGSYGPTGTQGPDGLTGVIGMKGFQGTQGERGPQGTEGLSGKFTWNINRSAENDTIFPNYQGGIEYTSVALLIGATDGSPEDTTLPAGITPSILLTHGNKNNLSLANNSKRGSFKTEPDGSNLNVNIGELSGAQPGSLEVREIVPAGGRKYKDQSKYGLSNEADDLLEVVEDNNTKKLKSYVDSKFNKNDPNAYVKAEGDFSYNNNAQPKKVLASLDVDGNLEWKNRYEVFSALPRGSFISIREEDFNNFNFNILDGSEIGDDGYLKIGYGRGRIGGDFEGWYLANGQKWIDGVLEFQVPNLNSFNYTIANTLPNNVEYEGIMEDVVVPNPNPVIIAGSSTDVRGVYNQTTGEYDITQDVESIDDSMSKGIVSSSTHLSIKRNVNIIKLGEASLYWLTDPDAGTVDTYYVELAFGNNADAACGNSTSPYFWTKDPNSNEWYTQPTAGEAIYTNNNGVAGPSPVSGWYELDGFARYWDGSSFGSQIIECPIIYTKDLVIRSTVMDPEINGATLPAGVTTTEFYIDTPLFKDATTLGIVGAAGASPGAGWVREFGTGGETYRRYWNGSSFTGDSISKLYVTQIDYYNSVIIKASSLNNSNACKDLGTTNITAYYARNSNPVDDELQYFYNLDKIYHLQGDRSIVYVNTNWTTLQGNTPVVKIWNQNRPGYSTPYYSLVEDRGNSGKKYALINTASELTQPVMCTIDIPVLDPLEFTLHSQSGSSISTGRTYVWNLSGYPQNGHVIRMGIYSTSINYTISGTTGLDLSYDTVGAAYASFLNNIPASQWLAAGVYQYTQGNPPGFKPTASYDSVNNRLTFNMNWQNSIGTPYVIPN
jgi:hypothetical protein